jgi:hypothetical protein
MSRKLKTYGWVGSRLECPPAPNGNRQTREICAAHSQAELARIAGVKRPSNLWNLCETGNKEEVVKVLSEPLTVFWRPLDKRRGKDWTIAKKKRPL